MDFYRVVYTSRTNLGNPYRGGSNESNIWLGADVSVALPVFAFGDGGAGLSLLPHVGAGFFSVVRAGVDVAVHGNDALYLMAGLEYQTFGRNFLKPGLGNWDSIDRSTLLDNLSLSIGIGFEWTSTFLEFQWRTTLGTPLYSAGPTELWMEDPTTLPSRDRGFKTVLVRFGWKLKGEGVAGGR
ncbi:MAG: hypothetical protein IPP94_18760 [Ignavibacteria bacterium]|nr:hypothetical protein [Ignavibacteria bacterium]